MIIVIEWKAIFKSVYSVSCSATLAEGLRCRQSVYRICVGFTPYLIIWAFPRASTVNNSFHFAPSPNRILFLLSAHNLSHCNLLRHILLMKAGYAFVQICSFPNSLPPHTPVNGRFAADNITYIVLKPKHRK